MIGKLFSWHKQLSQLLLLLAAVTILALITGQIFSSIENENTWNERKKRAQQYKAVIEGLEFNGLDEQTLAEIEKYREMVGNNSNLIVTEDTGKIIYHANDGFIPGDQYFIVLINPEDKYTKNVYILNEEKNIRYKLQLDEMYNSMRLVEYSRTFTGDTNVFADQNYSFDDIIGNYSLLSSPEKTMHYAYIGSKGWNVYSIQDILRNANQHYYTLQYWFNNLGTVSFILFWLILPIWTFIDAKKKNYKPALWGILTLLTNVIGLIIYILTKREISTCHSCGEILDDNHIFCPYCGTPNRNICTACNRIIEKGWSVCPYCGHKIEGSRPEQALLPDEAS